MRSRTCTEPRGESRASPSTVGKSDTNVSLVLQDEKEKTHFYTWRETEVSWLLETSVQARTALSGGFTVFWKDKISRAIQVKQESSPYANLHGQSFRMPQRISMIKTATGVGGICRWSVRNKPLQRIFSKHLKGWMPLSCMHGTEFVNTMKLKREKARALAPESLN